jgi:transposase, IS5 family
LITSKKKHRKVAKPACLFRFGKKEMIHNDTFVYSDHGHANVNKLRENEAKTRSCRDGTWIKKSVKSHFEYKLHSANRRDYELIKKFKTMTALLHNSQLDLSE